MTFTGEVMTPFYCAACAFWFQTNHPILSGVFGTNNRMTFHFTCKYMYQATRGWSLSPIEV